jgi:uncharacterized protein
MAKIAITNCHVHTFTHKDSPDRFLPWPVVALANISWFRKAFIWLARLADSKYGRIRRYAQILETSYTRDQAGVFEIVRGFYPEGTRFVVLPMDMTLMNAGNVEQSIDDQHEELRELAARDENKDILIPFAAVDPRHGPSVVDKTIDLIENQGFAGIKLYPPTGYHPYDRILHPLYEWAEEKGVPVLTHCSRPADVQYRGEPTPEMRIDPVNGGVLTQDTYHLLELFTDPDAYIRIMQRWPGLRLNLAHFGGAGDWAMYIERQRGGTADRSQWSWLSKILEMIRSGEYPNLWTDIAYTVFADDEYVYLLKVLLGDEQILAKTLFGSDFYVVENAELEERQRSVRIRAVLGEDVFRRIAEDNPKDWLGR